MATSTASIKSTIFYVNSVGIMCQWTGSIVRKENDAICIRFSKSKALRFDLKQSQFLLITKKKISKIGVCITENQTAVSFDDNLINTVIEKTAGNVECHWNGKGWNA